MRPDAATGTTTAKRDYLYFMRLAEKFNKKMEKLIRDDFEEYVDQIKVATNGFELDKLDEVSIGFNWKHDYEYEWRMFVKEKDEDGLWEDALEFIINDNFVLGKYLKELACEFDVKVGYYQDEQSGEIEVYIIDRSDIFYSDVVRISDFICYYVSDYREKMQRDEEEYTDTIHIDWTKFSERDARMLIENEYFTRLVGWRCEKCIYEMIDGVYKAERGLKVNIDC